MDSDSTLQRAMAVAGRQLDKCFEGWPEQGWDTALYPGGLSARDTVSHLAECYVAALAVARGQEHQWGSFQSSAADAEAKLAEMRELRAQATAALTGETPESLQAGLDYIALHDAYHVGQLCALRLSVQPDWDYYSIYS